MIDEVMFEIREMTGQEYRNHYAGEAPDTAAEQHVVARPARVTDPVPEGRTSASSSAPASEPVLSVPIGPFGPITTDGS